ncbi:MAG TPA: type II toxin-antitoxin system ParD family antitoxin [Deltaproteobacteria bacterium]|nr:type II toxin-antitoxin system ParD family antitoxin [Deltaproteobacteria bacterium]HHZ79276.1 type II toxin-antitoxin system ParD family antitoxin [Candidatus Lambdaproteobacteria bacterium]HIA57115.1 type II toxin-antitoxin system ParD family antitoxin [Candidatus Lambdaproteobacteria bacterium]HIB93390.1 type II toxin-antitoxin system ParD family antitoxin [Candidatus Lambdaproteobacteria bacterium]HIN48491.1 type II toxin-antitoxin system ParD family antitoxin [Deltaproteobacteria bacter
MNISLTPQLESMVKQKVGTGLYNSASEVVREALRLLEAKDQLNELKLTTLRQEIQKGLDSGESTPLNMEEIKSKAKMRRAN